MLLTWILVVVNILYGIPMFKLRYQFRSSVYKDKSWKINIKPWFIKETISLFSNKYLISNEEKKIGIKYRIYLFFNVLLLLALYYSAKNGL